MRWQSFFFERGVKMRASAVAAVALLLLSGCPSVPTLEPGDLDGTWRLTLDNGSFSCVTLSGGVVVAANDACTTPVTVSSPTPVAVSGDTITFGYVAGGVVRFGLTLTAQGDGTFQGETVSSPVTPPYVELRWPTTMTRQ